jgi:hypothetical protein
MIKRKTIGLLMCLLLSIQMLPVAAVGRLFYQNEITEELQDTDEAPVKSISFAVEMDKYILHSTSHPLNSTEAIATTRHTEHSSKLNAQHIKDVQTPPPNCA